MTEITLTPEDAADQIVTIKGRAPYVYIRKLFEPYGGPLVGLVQLADGIHVQYADGTHKVFQPLPYSGRVTDGPTPGTFVSAP